MPPASRRAWRAARPLTASSNTPSAKRWGTRRLRWASRTSLRPFSMSPAIRASAAVTKATARTKRSSPAWALVTLSACRQAKAAPSTSKASPSTFWASTAARAVSTAPTAPSAKGSSAKCMQSPSKPASVLPISRASCPATISSTASSSPSPRGTKQSSFAKSSAFRASPSPTTAPS